MKGMFVELVRELRSPVRARRQEKIREVELTWSNHDLANFRVFALGLQPAEMADVSYALADAVAIPLLELLVDYAELGSDLMRIVFQSLDRTPVSARLYLAARLFASDNPMVRAMTCRMLAAVGAPAMEFLAAALDDESAPVVAAAIRAIGVTGHPGVEDRLVSRLREPSEDVRFLALEAMIRLGARSDAFEKEALAMLHAPDETERCRRLAAEALARMRSEKGRLVLQQILDDSGRDTVSRRIAADALADFSDSDTARTLLKTVGGGDAGLAKSARQSLVKAAANDECILDVCAECLDGDDFAIFMAAAEVLGGASNPLAGKILQERLRTETRPPAVAAVAEALGRSGFSGAWDAILRKLDDGNGESLPLLAALADAAGQDNLDEYAALLDDLSQDEAGELVLRRLATFCRTVRPSPAILRRALDVLDSGNRELAIPAVEILAQSGDEGVRERLLIEMACLGPELPVSRLLRVMLRHTGGELAALFRETSPVAAKLTAAAAAEAECLGSGGVEYLCALAAWARAGEEGAREGLAAAAVLDPAQLVEAIRVSPDRVFLLAAWADLNLRDRLRHSPDLDRLFTLASPPDKLFALNILARLGEERHLRPVAALAFSERDPEVRIAAIALARTLAIETAEVTV